MGNEVVFKLPHTELAALQWLSQDASAIKVLSLHGWLDNAASFIHLAPYLADFSHTAVDMAGHGLSRHRPAGSFYHLWDYVLDTVSILNQSKQSVWLIGHSMGGAVAMLVAAIAPDKVRGLIILDNMGPLTGAPQDRAVTLQRAINKMAKLKLGRTSQYENKEAMVLARMEGFTKLSKSASKLLVERGAQDDEQGGWSWRHDTKLTFPSPFRMDEESVAAFIQEIKCPTLALMASQGIYANNPDFVEQRKQYFPWIKLQWLEGNHHFHLEPDTCFTVATQIKQFIDQN
ncbi:alpha/beta hydrolase [Marinomonas sp. THO17]|uniref:alpha/beta hydrolase n=1 Tax=Marinomonas sp. THO17 TaxID=3149048 RepID=UPI00336C02C2